MVSSTPWQKGYTGYQTMPNTSCGDDQIYWWDQQRCELYEVNNDKTLRLRLSPALQIVICGNGRDDKWLRGEAEAKCERRNAGDKATGACRHADREEHLRKRTQWPNGSWKPQKPRAIGPQINQSDHEKSLPSPPSPSSSLNPLLRT